MKFFPYHQTVFIHLSQWCVFALLGDLMPAGQTPAFAQNAPTSATQSTSDARPVELLVQRTIQRLALGDAFDAKLRQRIWAGGREVVGIGHYEQSGGGTGRYSLEMTIHDGDLRHTNHQISDGKLAWIRTHLGDSVTLRRVDLGRIDEFYRELVRQGLAREPRAGGGDLNPGDLNTQEEWVQPWMRVGGLVELIDQIAHDYKLRISKGYVDERAVWILRGELTPDAFERMTSANNGSASSELSPFEVRMAIAATGDESGFGIGLPTRIEFWGQPPTPQNQSASVALASSLTSDLRGDNDSSETGEQQYAQLPIPSTTPPIKDVPRGQLISLLEIHALRRIQPSPEERFRFEREDRDVAFFNDTRRYLERIAQRDLRIGVK